MKDPIQVYRDTLYDGKDFVSYAEEIAVKAVAAAVREQCAVEATNAKYDDELGEAESAWNAACEHIADGLRGQR